MLIITIEETTAVNARRSGVTKEFKSLSSAKRYATKNQAFHGTVLNLFSESRELLAYKSGNTWFTTQDGIGL